MLTNENDSFFMVLPSDSNLDIYPDNSAGQFIVQLDKTKNLNQPMECSLFDIILPKLSPIVNFEVYVCFWEIGINFDIGIGVNFKNQILKTITIGPETISNRLDFIEKLPKNIEKYLEWNTLKESIYNKFPDVRHFRYKFEPIEFRKELNPNGNLTLLVKRGKVQITDKIKAKQILLVLFFNNNLCEFLDAPKTLFALPEKEVIIDERPLDMEGLKDKNSFFYYLKWWWYIKRKSDIMSNTLPESSIAKNLDIFLKCDFINESYINNNKFPYLRLIHCDANGKSKFRFEPLIYYTLNKESLNSMKIELLDKNFGKIEFQNGSSIIILHFRKLST